MANTNAPFGFMHIASGGGGAPTYANSRRRISPSNATAIYFGDPVMPVVSTANGYITQAAAGTTRLDGIFVGCKYLSIARKQIVWSNYWPGSDANTSLDVEAYVIDDPNARFKVQASSTGFTVSGTASSFTSSVIGQYAQFTIGTGSTSTGISGSFVSSVATTVTFPFIVVDLVTDPPGANGTDPTTGYNHVIVGFNNEVFRSNGAGPTGIS